MVRHDEERRGCFRVFVAGDHAVILRDFEFGEDILVDTDPGEDDEIAPLLACKARLAAAPATTAHQRLARQQALGRAARLLGRIDPMEHPRTGARLAFAPQTGPRS